MHKRIIKPVDQCKVNFKLSVIHDHNSFAQNIWNKNFATDGALKGILNAQFTVHEFKKSF